MKVLVACEFSGRVRNAFAMLGHEVTSCDFHISEQPCVEYSRHITCDVRQLISKDDCPYDLVIAHPPCTLLCSLGSQHWIGKASEQQEAIDFFMFFTKLPAAVKVCIENPIGIMSDRYRRYDQVIQPWMFGEPVTKKTCLWLRGLAPLQPTKIVAPVRSLVGASRRVTEGNERWRVHSRTPLGVALAMAVQWG